MKERLPAKTALPIFATFFFFSGAAGLVYEVLWMRQFGRVMGNTTVSLSAVLTAFMGGLAIGSWIGGRIADRRHDHLRLYGLLEVAIGLYALSIPTLIVSIKPILAALYRPGPGTAAFALLPYVRFVLALAIMVVPTIFMGATLPLLIKYFTARSEEVGARVGLIYGINTVGAMAGAFLAGFFLIPGLGMRLT
ncbi:MAG: fused MFS/spermidine synthase, partial [Candidatus Sumerlaeota bacterium]|nr:fused MFS/spermidine synthase [Candidatus Sumerlaeota bacterium]